MHSPPWWEHLFREPGLLRVETCYDLDDAEVLHEDLVKYQIEHDLDPADVGASIEQIEHGRLHLSQQLPRAFGVMGSAQPLKDGQRLAEMLAPGWIAFWQEAPAVVVQQSLVVGCL